MAESSSILATRLDSLMLMDRRIVIADPGIPLDQVPLKSGRAVFDELGGRYVIRFLVAAQVGRFAKGDAARHYVTPTLYTPSDAIIYLALPSPTEPRTHALLLDPRRIPAMRGPQWVAPAAGIQYILPDGFPQDAIVVPGAPGAAWEIVVH